METVLFVIVAGNPVRAVYLPPPPQVIRCSFPPPVVAQKCVMSEGGFQKSFVATGGKVFSQTRGYYADPYPPHLLLASSNFNASCVQQRIALKAVQ